MNFFYGVNNEIFKSTIQIPIFQNRNLKKNNLRLFKSYPENNEWILKEVNNKKVNDYFFILKENDIYNDTIFFLADNLVFKKFDKNNLKKLNNFTDTSPAFRSNLQIYLKNGGFSSYQSEYPFAMVKKMGTILSSVYSLANAYADNNYILIKNIYEKPISEKFEAYFVNYKLKKIEEEFEIKTNYTNCIKISNKLIKPEIFFITKKYLGIPMYVSEKNSFLSFEHTHPPHEYILSKNKFLKVSELKEKINEIIA